MSKSLFLLALVSAALLCPPAAAVGECTSTLTITTEDDPSGQFRSVTVDVTGSLPLASVLLAVGRTEGETTIGLPLGSFTVGLERPFALPLIGVADEEGNLSRTFQIATAIGNIGAVDLLAQAIGVSLSTAPGLPVLESCPSNLASLGF
jgi:hypothetical protein